MGQNRYISDIEFSGLQKRLGIYNLVFVMTYSFYSLVIRYFGWYYIGLIIKELWNES